MRIISRYGRQLGLFICLMALVAGAGLSGHADANESNTRERIGIEFTDTERQWIQNHPKVILGVDPGFAPFEFSDQDGTYQGIASEYVAMIEAALGIELRVASGFTACQRWLTKQVASANRFR